MKLNPFIFVILGISLLVSACVRDDDRLFEDSASARLQKALAADQKIL